MKPCDDCEAAVRKILEEKWVWKKLGGIQALQ